MPQTRWQLSELGLALLGLSTLALAVPLFQTLASGATFFVAHSASAADILLFAALVYIAPVAALCLVYLLLRLLSVRLATLFATLAAAVLAALFLISLIRPDQNTVLLGGLIALCLVSYYLISRQQSLRDFLAWLGRISPLVPAAFLLLSPVKLLLQSEAPSESGQRGNQTTPIVVLVLDELPLDSLLNAQGQIAADRLPNFARLASLSTWYSNTTTVSGLTDIAVPALLSGQRPKEKTVPTYQGYRQNLFTALAHSHSIHAVETATRLCPPSVCSKDARQARQHSSMSWQALLADSAVIYLHSILGQSLAREWLPAITGRWKGFATAAQTEQTAAAAGGFTFMDMTSNRENKYLRFVDSLNAMDSKELYYYHLPYPHSPWFFLPDGTQYNGDQVPGRSHTDYLWGDDEYLVEQALIRYGLQLEYVDMLLGSLLDTVSRSALFKEMMLVVVSDHGLAFQAGEHARNAEAGTLAAIARVPLFIKYPGQTQGRRIDHAAETIDLFPSIADSLNIPLDQPVAGRSLLDSDKAHRTARQIHQGAEVNPRFEALLQQSTAAADFRMLATAGSSTMSQIGQGAGKALLNRSVASLPTGPASAASVRLDQPRWYQQVKRDSGFLPALFQASIKGAQQKRELLIALNGVIAGSGSSHDNGSRASILLQAGLFQEGHNELAVYELQQNRLLPMRIENSSPEFSLSFSSTGTLAGIRLLDRQWLPGHGDLRGRARISGFQDVMQTIGGWAYDHGNASLPEHLLLLSGQEVLSSAFRRSENPLVAPQRTVPMEAKLSFLLRLGPELRQHRKNLSVVALFPNGELLNLPLR